MTSDERLKSIREQLDKGETPEPATVKTLLGWFGAQRRGWQVVFTIDEALGYYGLVTVPYFAHEYIYSTVHFRKEAPVETQISPSTTTSSQGKTSETLIEESSYKDPTYRIGALEAANKPLIWVNPDSELSEAITLMLAYDYSQLPVMLNAKRNLKGVISWRSIGKAMVLSRKPVSKVREVMESSIELIPDNTSLFMALPIIIEHDYVLVENDKKEITGIVTASDLSLQFQQLSEPFLLISEIEKHLRIILSKLDKSYIQSAKDEKDSSRTIESIHDLTFGEYVRLFEQPEVFQKLSLQFDRKTLCLHLDQVREIRNDVMHFSPDPIDKETLGTLRRVVRLLQLQRDLSA
jgi:predicted transcriptional regulator